MRIFVATIVGAVFALSLASNAIARIPGSFSVTCSRSHALTDDPIVHPGFPGTSHLHDFYGARTANANSTYQTMVGSGTSCGSIVDTAGYWHPTLQVGGSAVNGTLHAYYTSGNKSARSISNFPAGLMMLAGSPNATEPQPRSRIAYRCIGRNSRSKATALPRRCRRSQKLASFIRFPDCWNGHELDTPNHRDHVAYSRKGLCPTGFPYSMPILAYRIDWNVHTNPANIMLSNGSPIAMHADFWNTWQQSSLLRLVKRCIRGRRACGLLHS